MAEREQASSFSPSSFLFKQLQESSSPYINRFLSADTIVPGYANPQNLNRYSYVTNNPLRYTDPTGHMIDGGCQDYGCGSTTPIDYEYIPAGNDNGSSSGGGSTLTPASTPSLAPTPCPLVAIACLPPSTSTPSVTPMPTLVTGPSYTDYSTPPSPFPDINFYIDPGRVDWIDVAIDGGGLTVDLLTIFPATAPIGAAAQPGASVIEGIGFVKSAVELVRGDPRSMLYDQTMNQGKRVIVMVAKFERLAPAWGAFGSAVSLWLNLKPQISVDWGKP